MTGLSTQVIAKAAQLIRDADSIIVAAGAGMGVDSGLPDFRGNEGFWKAYPALAKANLDFAEVASPNTFERNIRLAWGFYGHRLALYRETIPHQGFALLKQWGEAKAKGYSVFTSNVDGQFQKAGFDPIKIHECHGSIHHLQCLYSCSEAVWEADKFKPDVDAAECHLNNMPPPCKECGDYARPNILMFGDWGWVNLRTKRQAARQQEWLATVKRPVVIELGAGIHIPSVRHFSKKIVEQFNGNLIRINPRDSDVDRRENVGFACGALEGLEAIAQLL